MLERRDEIERLVQVTPADKPTRMLVEKVHDALSGIAGRLEAPLERVIQIRVPIGKLDPVQWLRKQSQQAKLFWESRDDSFFSAAVGIADEVKEVGETSFLDLKRIVETRLQKTSRTIKYYGGMRFDNGHASSNDWPSLGDFHFVLPRFEIQGAAGQYALCCNLVLPQDVTNKEQIVKEIEQINFPDHPLSGECPLPISRKDSPEESKWNRVVNHALSMIRSSHVLEKVVLARKVQFSFAERFDNFLLFKLLRDATPSCFHFYFQNQSELAFLGAPPEQLYQRKEKSIVSEAVAGTGRRDHLNALDIELGHALLLSDKDQHEHAFVRSSIERVFDTICTRLKMDKTPSLMNLSIGRHLVSKFEGHLQEGVSDIDILEQLPPTSAVGGHPKKEALETIRNLESFDRGWYAGPIGWMSRDAAEFAVAIRSGVAAGDTLSLYSGAGIVDGSKPDAEWSEIEQKIGDFIKALGLDQKSAKY